MENIFRWEVVSICLAVGGGGVLPHPHWKENHVNYSVKK